ncbi:MAG TPA: endonuclease III [Paenalcaligenes hominis]|uniref:Endonuclease III n=1 Tax=Paenalcaligenes hominis TaxID=643674 RepID=A0A9D2VEM1_9BURK|nr:endonuclease III [Paenalcaligenes hominis]NJB63829.1 endonuclease-3 [Paenalcaligenes hominis]GGE60931.1 endonuclease III [Paenalcaligenes hominis]HJH23327.1 endonuclease III [Paenalcaligenes hominis]
MNRQIRTEIFERFRAANPHPTTELEYENTFQLLIAVILSAQATDVSVNIATRRFFPTHGSPEGIIALGLEGLTECIKSIGLYKTKAKNVMRTCEILLEEYQGVVPNTRAALEALPGVGRKTANVVLNTAFGLPAMAVDTHIFRVSNRTGIAKGKNVREVEDRLMRLVPREFLLDAHHWLILHGRYVCVARKPKCPECGIADLCEFKEKTTLQQTK